MDGTPKVERAVRAEVGRLFAGSKVRYEWVVRVGGAVVHFIFKDSKNSKRKFLSVNGKVFLDEVAKDPKFEVTVHLEPHTFCIFPEGNGYRLRINSHVDNTGMQVVKAPAESDSFFADPVEFQKGKDGAFRMSVTQLESASKSVPTTTLQERRSAPNIERPHIVASPRNGQRPSDPTLGLNGHAAVPRPSAVRPFETLGDSFEFYPQTGAFMMIKELQENPTLVKAINRLN